MYSCKISKQFSNVQKSLGEKCYVDTWFSNICFKTFQMVEKLESTIKRKTERLCIKPYYFTLCPYYITARSEAHLIIILM